ncbi:ATP dependent helicase, Lhr family [Archaeoglobus sulfaticallidus PM70-1]|uniref:ATP dependent helicase, Lhr family n=1 Tax=Archaeoglobus sulfaticallidus PM70-1 TaxID=387631 RepID=N0BP47_9EURY|nr:ATP-dependent helicase [Archaeoglobus sulfaticallidus]AGK62120.1 ATP dependent helicase, Lhr family [Archaeoglobus sulfaticallidus PM70-1]
MDVSGSRGSRGIVEGKEYSDEEIEKFLHPLVVEWFKGKYRSFTPPQKHAIVEALNRNNILISSPTGSGKTLAAFLASISMLIDLAEKNRLEDKVYTLYVSPLKALNNDIRKNLEEPLKEIYEIAESKGLKLQKIRIGVRTGDTDPSERQRQVRKPPHILITTPETLSIILVSPKFSKHLSNLDFLIVDEIHAIAENKRGTHLSLSIERLQEIQEGRMVRIGLSATIHPLEEVAKFLVGFENGKVRDCIIADVSFLKPIDIKVISPVKDFFRESSEQISEKLYNTLADLVKSSKTTLIFTNTRSATERVVYNLKKKLGSDFPIKAHHSSLSKNVRLEVEDELKNGELRCVVSSTSLELGIDIGYIDLVVLLGSPKSINRALQRIGRSGHKLHEVSVGRVVVVDHDDLVECTVLTYEALNRRLDRIKIPEKPLDVLCQHVVGMAIERKWGIDEALKVIRRSYPYRNLTKDEFLEVLRYLAGYSDFEKNRVYGKIWLDEKEGTFGKRGKLVRPIYYLNTGTIPDEVAVKVITKDGKRVGKVEEEFAERLIKGDIFVLAGRTFRFLKSRGMNLIVEEVEGEKPTVPSWFSEQLPLSYDLALRIQRFRREVEELLGSELLEFEDAVWYLRKKYMLERDSAEAIVRYFYEQKVFSYIPTDRRFLIENFQDEGNECYVFHSLIGRRANSAISRVLAYRAGLKKNCSVKIAVNDNGFMLKLPRRKVLSFDEILELMNVENFEEDLIKALDRTEILRRRFRHVAVRSLMVLRNYLGREKSVWRQQLSADSLLRLIKKKFGRNFPVLKETYREIMEDSMDLGNAIDFLTKLEKKEIKLTRIPFPSPFALNIFVLGEEDIVLMEDRKKVIQSLYEKITQVIELNG